MPAKKVEEGPHPQQKYVHVIILSLSLLQFVFLICVMTDGHAVATLKENPPNVFNCINSPAQTCGNYTLRDIVYYPYGLGAAYDQYHMKWYSYGGWEAGAVGHKRNLKDEVRFISTTNNAALADNSIFDMVMNIMKQDNVPHHIVSYFGCGHLEKLGRAVQAFTYISFALVSLQIITSAAHNGDLGGTWAKGLSLGLQLFLFICFLILTCGIAAIYNKEWMCNNPYITKMTLMDHFDIGYAIAMVVVGLTIPPINTIFLSLWAEDGPAPVEAAEEAGEEMEEGAADAAH